MNFPALMRKRFPALHAQAEPKILINRACRIVFFVIAGIYLVSLFKLNSFKSVTWDEENQLRGTLVQLREAASLLAGKGSASFYDSEGMIQRHPYGVINKLPATLLAGIAWPIVDPTNKIVDFPFDYYIQLSHFTSFIFALATCWVLLHAGRQAGLMVSWLAPLLLVSTPTFMGHSIFNIKDVPFAFFYTLYSLFLVQLVLAQDHYFRRWVISVAIVTGLVSSLKFTVYPLLLAITVIPLWLRLRAHQLHPRATLWYLAKQFAIIMVISLAVSILSLPGSWPNPPVYLYNAFKEFQNYKWNSCINFASICTGKFSGTIGWTSFAYLTNWLSIKLTIINIFSFGLACLCVLRSLPALCSESAKPRQIIRLAFGSQALVIPIAIVLANSNLYDEIRHILFILPAAAYLGADSIQEIFASLSSRIARLFLGLLLSLLLLLNIIDSAALAPYQYTYFNEFSRPRHVNGGTEVDHWGASVGELFLRSRSLTKLFPLKTTGMQMGPLDGFRRASKVLAPQSDQQMTSLIRFRTTPDSPPPPASCPTVTCITRTYPLTGQLVKLSELVLCPLETPGTP